MAKPEKREKARELRKCGWRITDIAAELNVHISTVSGWCRDIKLTEKQIAENSAKDNQWAAIHENAQRQKQRGLESRLEFQEIGREIAQKRRTLHLMGCMLYWGEGSKHRHSLSFANSDPNMVILFVRFLREELHVSDEKMRLRAMAHTEDETEQARIKYYWLNILNLPENCYAGFVHKKGTTSRKKHYPNGFCYVSVHSTEIVQQIFGAIQEYANFDKPEWVE